MSRIFNFSAGPSTLPLEVLEQAREELPEYRGRGMSILEMSHRSKEFDEVHEKALSLLGELLILPANHRVLFLAGGATLQFSMVPLNLLSEGKSCDFTLSGSWAKKAYADARTVGKVDVVFDGEKDNYTRLPDPGELRLNPKAAYLHLTSNETIGGVQWHRWPDAGTVPIVCDMSSDFLSRPLPLERIGLMYAGAQKNLGPAGVTVVVVRDDVLDACSANLTAYMSYRTHADKNSLYNTPPVFAVYLMRLVLEWLKKNGGVDWSQRMAEQRSSLLYESIESSNGFYRCPVPREHRSKMNVVFRLPTEELEKTFIAEAQKEGMSGLKGHRSVGGCRASIYNAMPLKGAEVLSSFMQHFASRHG
jgi:phosphoserine aminotransferase